MNKILWLLILFIAVIILLLGLSSGSNEVGHNNNNNNVVNYSSNLSFIEDDLNISNNSTREDVINNGYGVYNQYKYVIVLTIIN